MDDDDDVCEEDCIMVVVKSTAGAEWDAVVNKAGDVGAMKDAIAEQHDLERGRMRLIYRGKILADHASLEELGVAEGHAIHMVMDKKPQVSAAPVVVEAESSTVNVPGVGGLDRGMLQSLKDNPMMDWLAENPDMMREMMLASNPRLKEAMERDPQMAATLNNPETTRQMIEMIRNPAALEQMSRSMDRQMTQISNIPGGHAHLERAVHSMNHAMDLQHDEPETTSSNAPPVPAGVPLPNPWDRPAGASSPQNQRALGGMGMGMGMPGMGMGGNPFAALGGMGGMGGMPFGSMPAAGGAAPSSGAAPDYSTQVCSRPVLCPLECELSRPLAVGALPGRPGAPPPIERVGVDV